MANFCITAVRYNAARTHLETVWVREEKSKTVGAAREVPRIFVADLIRLGLASFQTRTKNTEGKWSVGAQVHLFEDEFLTTDPNATERDNLGSLPEV